MSPKQLVLGTFVGARTPSATGYVIFGIAFPGFFTNFLNAGPAMNVERQPPLFWAVALAMLSYGLLMALAAGGTARPLTTRAGVTTGAVVSFLLWFTADFMLHGISNVGTLGGAVTDPLLEMIPGAIAGGVIAAVLRTIR
jgi:hypothetical protein